MIRINLTDVFYMTGCYDGLTRFDARDSTCVTTCAGFARRRLS